MEWRGGCGSCHFHSQTLVAAGEGEQVSLPKMVGREGEHQVAAQPQALSWWVFRGESELHSTVGCREAERWPD